MYKVLIIEDDEIARKQMAKFVQKEGFEVLEAEDGSVGIALFRSDKPHIVITDMKMPKMDGIEVVKTIKKISPETNIILVTAFGETDVAIAALREGVMDYLKKPIDLRWLRTTLGRAKEKLVMQEGQALTPVILLVEDEELPRKRLTRVLEKENWKVVQAVDGEDAVKQFNVNRIDLVLTDIKMPKMNGLQALHNMRKVNGDFEAIVFTGYGDEDSAIQAMRDGAINFLKKPVDIDQLIVSIEKALDHLHLDRALKYRNRELELARQIITQITAEQEVIINLHKSVVKQTLDFAKKLLDAIPMSLFVMKRDFTIVYVNNSLSQITGSNPEKIDDHMIEKMKNMGIKELSLRPLTEKVNSLYETPGRIEVIKTGEFSYLTLTLIKIVGDEKDSYVLVAVRGERPDLK
ncbi:Signal transduction response regulator, receiver region domain protein [Candidatus Magnetobacterium bavaricum]|uniref:Signal transduction response regulator, receiver region domain protein n=1 Tax=Candidatus Magnetobacterium bavaricum TaxID=29290 RepID=A0A0F3GJ01_9BACT|nr:Signal transduction response regulator, receiver region domain protein [Candidatus Magnetobacterium bavaricum]